MDELLRGRLEARYQKMIEASQSAKSLLDQCQTGTVHEGEFTLCKLQLIQTLESFERELQSCITNMKDIAFISNMTDGQLNAESTLVEMNATTLLSKTPNAVSAKLPKLDLPKFNGDQLKWSEFWDRFRSNIHDKEIGDADKLSYLLSSLEGKAMEAVAGLPTTDANYPIAVEALQRRFGSTDILIDAHYTALNYLPRADSTAPSCRSTLDAVERHLRVLEQLGESTDGNHLRALILTKFPKQVVHEHHLTASDNNSLSAIRKNLERIVSALEKSSVEVATHARPEVLFSDMDSAAGTTSALCAKAQTGTRSNLKRKRKPDVTLVDEAPPQKRRRQCIFCKLRNHSSADCKKYKTIDSRKSKLADRCTHCLKKNHSTESCKRKIACFRCKGDHLMIFCPKPASGEEEKLVTEHSILETICKMSHGYTFLQTAVAKIQNITTNATKSSRILLDSGSQRSYITERMVKALKLPSKREDLLLIYTFGASSPQEMTSPCTEVFIETKRGAKGKIQVNIVPCITNKLPIASLTCKDIDILADDDSIGEDIDMLIGNDYYSSFMREGKIEIGTNLHLLDTDFGWVLSGHAGCEVETDILSVTTYCQCHMPGCPYFTEPDLPLRNIDVKFLWSLENIGITDSPKATRQEEAVRHFNETVKYQNGRYEVKWPWIEYPPELPTNYGLSLGRLRSLLRRLDQESLMEYNKILTEQLELGIIEKIEEPDPKAPLEHSVHYLPHHMVKQTGKRGRLVYDASAKISGQKSLNECLFSGPSMLEDLVALLLKFRTKSIGITADVEKAFLQVGLQEEDRDVTRFLWIKDLKKGATDDNLLYLRFCRVPFGVISSPFLLNATIRYHMSQSDDNLLESIAKKCYVDNLVTGANSLQEARQVYSTTRSTFEQLSMNIRDWVSNSKQFMNELPDEHKTSQSNDVKVLGLTWKVDTDTLTLKTTQENLKPNALAKTKREVLRTLARIYDPCGFVCPLLLPLKLLFQNICEKKIKWDTLLPGDLIEAMKSILENIKDVANVELPRNIGISLPDKDTKYELHCFTDASKNAYAAVVYLKTQSNHQTAVSFVIAKCRISQVKDREDLRMPRLELLGFLIGSRLLKYVNEKLDLPIQRKYLWTDSLVVLGWMRSNKLLPPFVANRVKEIQKDNQDSKMCYVHTKSNPADVATRPELWEQKKDLWFNGPDFLKLEASHWPESHHYETHQTFLSVGEDLDVSPGELEGDDDVEMEQIVTDVLPDKNVTTGNVDNTAHNENIREIRKLQQQHFPEELSGKTTHLVRNLDLFLDIDDILRCRGRMANANWSYDMKYPILIPKACEFTNQVIKKIHEENYHVGASHTLSIIRRKYWIPQGKIQVQKVIRTCPKCIKHGGGPYKLPEAPALPAERVNYSEPFTFTGVDYFGPLLVTGNEKRWVALFTCLTVRAIHLEIVKDLTAEECLLAIRRFAASRGLPKRIYSDNATYFKLTSEIMRSPFCIENKVEWKFIPQLAPWHGGFYERLVGLVKHCLKRTLEKHLLNDSKLLTVIKEVETVANSRPLTQVGTEVSHVLRPADFLSLGKCLLVNPSPANTPCIGTATKTDLIESWKRGLKIIEEFKKMFIGQYLTSLRERYSHTPKQPRVMSSRQPKIGDLVQIKSDHKNRNNWQVGKIIDLIQGADSKCRVARVKTKDTTLTRSIGHLYPIEADSDENINPSPPVNLGNDNMSVGVPVEEETITSQNDHHMQDEELTKRVPTPEAMPTEPMEVEPTHKTMEVESTHEHIDVEPSHEDMEEPNASANSETIQNDGVPQPANVEMRSRRDAAIRARNKILEWTRQLVTLLR